jgi:hypothetical protein
VVLRQKRRFDATNLHLYHYAGNNPVKYVDPTGQWIDNEDGTYTAEEGDTLYDKFGENWKEKTGFDRDPKSLQVGETVTDYSNPKVLQDTNQNTYTNDSVKKSNLQKPILNEPKDKNVVQSWWSKKVGEQLTDAESKLQFAIGTTEMIGGPIAGIGLCEATAGQSFILGMYVMADGAFMITEAQDNKKAYPFSLLPTFLLSYAKTDDGMIFYTGF